MKRNIPKALIFSRIPTALGIGLLAFFQLNHYPTLIVSLMTIGLLTDIFDGIIARRMGISTKELRILDSNVDQFFWLVTITSIFYLNYSFVKTHAIVITSIILLEIVCYLVSYTKFKKPVATHSLLAKFWTLSLIAFLIDLCLNNNSHIPFLICISLGIISRIEIILIIIGLKKWTTDVPSIFVVSKINKGIPFKKSILFNS